MTEREVRELVAEVLVLRNNAQWREDDDRLVATGAVVNSQVGGADIRERAAHLREMCPSQMLLQTDMETASPFAADGTQIGPLMALGATDDEGLADDWGHAVGLEGRRLGVDTTWSPVLDVNTNPDNPIINVRAFGENAEQIGRLGAAMTRGFLRSGLHPCAKHWPGHGDVAVDSHIALPTLQVTRERLETIDWLPYRVARQAGPESAMTAHLLVPAVDPENCATVSHALITGVLREQLGYDGCLFTDSLGMEGLRLTMDSAEAAWMALAAGHDQVLVDYKRSPVDSVEAVVAACMDGRVPEARLRDAVARVLDLKLRLRSLPPLPSDAEIRAILDDIGQRLAEASITLSGALPEAGPDLGDRPLVVILDDLQRYGVSIAEEKEGSALEGAHPLAEIMHAHLPCEVVLCDEDPDADDLARVQARIADATAVVGATVAHIQSYKGSGVRLPVGQKQLWDDTWSSGKLRGMMLFESPYALSDLPADVPVVIGYGSDDFNLAAAAEAVLGKRSCPGALPVTVSRG